VANDKFAKDDLLRVRLPSRLFTIFHVLGSREDEIIVYPSILMILSLEIGLQVLYNPASSKLRVSVIEPVETESTHITCLEVSTALLVLQSGYKLYRILHD
jgi:hypothetical protein